jgi:hypothetical protein
MTNVESKISTCHVQDMLVPERATMFVPTYTGEPAKHAILRKSARPRERSSLKIYAASDKKAILKR